MSKHSLAGMALAAALVAAGLAPAHADSPDAWLTTKAKIALLTADDVSASAVNVDTTDGRVTIHGKVKTADEKARAEAAVRKVDGVKEVKNLLQVVPESQKDAVNASDDSIEDSVQAALGADPATDDVKVKSVNKGVVMLSGKTADLNGKLKAIEVTLAQPGVRRVASEIETDQK